jgi:transcriptional regulator with XRE-family HTH domain
MPNDRLRSALRSTGYTEQKFGEELGVDPKTIQRWITTGRTPHRTTALRAASLLNVPAGWLWPELDKSDAGKGISEVIAFYPHRSETPKHLWLELLIAARTQIDLTAYASLFLPEENPDAINIIAHKAASGVSVRIALGDPDSPEAELRGHEERLFDAIPARIRMALAYYRPLVGLPGVAFHLHRTTLYNSIFRYDDQMLINQHIFGMYGYIAPILHLRRCEGADLFDTYARSFERIWEESYPISDPGPSTLKSVTREPIRK